MLSHIGSDTGLTSTDRVQGVRTRASWRFAMVVSGYPPAQTAGMEHGCQRLAAALARRGHQVAVLTMASPDLPGSADEDGVSVHRALRPRGLGPLWGLSYRRQVRRWLIDHLHIWDLVMCHQLYLHSVEANRVARASGRCACHLLVAAQTYSDITRLRSVRGGRWMLRRAVDDADALLVLSAHSRRELEEIGTDPAKIHDYRYFVDVDRFAPDGTPPAREFLCLGRWHEQKNLPLLLDAFDRIGRDCPDMHLRFAGGGPAEQLLRTRIAASPFADRIHVEGWATDPVPLYRRAWAVVISSDAEGLSNVMIEAMACGTPVITTDVSGAREALDLVDVPASASSGEVGTHGAGGVLVPMRSPLALAAAMRTVAAQEDLRRDLSAQARRRTVEAFSETVNVDGFLKVATRCRGARIGQQEVKRLPANTWERLE